MATWGETGGGGGEGGPPGGGGGGAAVVQGRCKWDTVVIHELVQTFPVVVKILD